LALAAARTKEFKEMTSASNAAPSAADRMSRADMLPVEGSVDLALKVERLWEIFEQVERWPEWNPCIARARLDGGRRVGAVLRWTFKVRHLWLARRMPVSAPIVEWEPRHRVTWERNVLGFHVVHTYSMEDLGGGRSRFTSWECATGPTFRATRGFWLDHFKMVCDASLRGAKTLEQAS
jgi:hypothetical protein